LTPERWKEIDQLVQAALACPSEERPAFLAQECTGDDALRREVEALLAYQTQASDFLGQPALEHAAAVLASPPEKLAAGSTIGHYQIIEPVGEGGMGEVYLARDQNLDRKVALKLLPRDFTNDIGRVRRFKQEACAASALNHPNIITIHEIGAEGDVHFIATEFIEGEDLRAVLARGPVKTGVVLAIAEQVASALVAAHEAGIIHRDIKPENIMVRRDSIVKVLDFGLAKLTLPRPMVVDTEMPTRALVKTHPGIVLGTVHYMSPEQARGLETDARTDLWSLGCVVYELFAGRVPFSGKTSSDVLAALLERELPPLTHHVSGLPTEVDWIVQKALRKDREERYQTAKELLTDLKRVKQRLEFAAELERSAPPEGGAAAAAATSGGHSAAGTTGVATAQTGAGGIHATSSAEYIVTQVKRHKRGAVVALGVLALAAAVTLFWYFEHPRAAPVLTEKDTIVLADFVNTTGDAVFDGTLKQALAVALEQSPFLNIFPEQRVQETLRFMNRSPDERVTRDVAREICVRQGLKAYLAGSISNLGSHLVITLEAVNAQTGDTLARQQVEAESKEQVLSALGGAATKLREKLGETLASIQKYDAPIEQATTSSLEALKAYSLGREQHYKGKEAEAIPLIQRAIELDPNFALAYDGLAWLYYNLAQRQLAREAMQKAFELRERASQYEKLKIAADYYWIVAGDMEKAIESLELLTRTYPRDYVSRNNLASRDNALGRYEQAIEEAREAIHLNPNYNFAYGNLALAFIRLNRFDEAKEIYEQALAQKFDRARFHAGLYTIAFVRGDTTAMQQQLDWARGKPDEYNTFLWQAETAEFLGQLRRARELYQRFANAELSRNLQEDAANAVSVKTLGNAAAGNCQQAREEVARASALPGTEFSFPRIGLALALCGELVRAQSLADEGAKLFPKNTLINAVWLPAIRTAIEVRRNNPAQAIQFLQSADRYDRVGGYDAYWAEYLRGQAYLAQGVGAEAASEFQKILDRKSLAPTSVLYPLAHLGLARAATRQGDSAKARKAYQDFFALWKDADADIPILLEAKKEYEKLK